MEISKIISKNARANPTRNFISHNNENINYFHAEKNIKKISNFLKKEFQKERVALIFPRSISYILSLFGTYRSKNVAVPLDSKQTISEIKNLIELSKTKTLIIDKKLIKSDSFIEIKRNFDFIISSYYQDNNINLEVVHRKRSQAQKYLNKADTRLILFTSGTSGKKKGVMLSERNLYSNAESIVDALGISSNDKGALCICHHYAYGNSIINSHVLSGGSIRIYDNFLLPTLLKYKLDVTIFYGVPYAYACFLRNKKNFKILTSSVKKFTSAGESMNKKIIKELLKDNNIEFFNMYGQTEATARISILSSKFVDQLPSVGKPLSNVQIKINSRKFDDPRRSVGEILIRGPNVMQGYLDDEDATKKKVKNGWLYTGDVGEITPKGFINIYGRIDDLFKIKGSIMISPLEIEKIINKDESIRESMVFPKLVNDFSELAVALVVDQERFSRSDLIKQLKLRLSTSRIPKHYIFVDSLPRTTNNKLNRKIIINRYGK